LVSPPILLKPALAGFFMVERQCFPLEITIKAPIYST
jgi:hypothetical protein